MEMDNTKPLAFNFALAPFEYHTLVRDHFKSRSKTWNWFSADELMEKQIEDLKSSLLKNTYRLDKETHPKLYATAAEVCSILGLDAEVTLYQEHNSVQLNAGISSIGKEAHVVLSGNLIALLTEEEMKALLAHELSHYLFNKLENGDFEISQRIILALANDTRSDDSVIETARIFQLYLELFCDAGALTVCGDHKVVIQTLVKLNTGLTTVNADSYLKQANEIVSTDSDATSRISHPESYIRSIALQLRHTEDKEYAAKIEAMISGELDLNKLDIFKQSTMADMTHRLLQLIVKPKWMASSGVLNLATQYFQDFYRDAEQVSLKEVAEEIAKTRDSVKNYICYILLDFAKVDPDLENAPLAYTLELSELLGIGTEHEKLLRKELKLTVREFKLLQEQAMAELQQVKEAKEDSIYED